MPTYTLIVDNDDPGEPDTDMVDLRARLKDHVNVSDQGSLDWRGGYCWACEDRAGYRVHHETVFTDSRSGRNFCHECVAVLVSWEMAVPRPEDTYIANYITDSPCRKCEASRYVGFDFCHTCGGTGEHKE